MINDIKAIMWKEWKEFFFQQTIRSKLTTLIAIAVIGVLLPIKRGAGWFDLPFFYTVGAIGPLLTMSTVICDLFAGERERHTLETLLASRLSDRGIVLGKLIFAMSYAAGITLLLLLLNVIAVNVEYYKGVSLIFSVRAILIVAVINFSLALFGSLIGAIISIKAATVKQAQLILSVSIIVLLFLISSLITNYLPTSVIPITLHLYNVLGPNLSIVLLCIIFLKINLLILQYVFSRYKRVKIFG